MNPRRSLRNGLCVVGLLAAGVMGSLFASPAAQSNQLIVDLLTSPQKYWNTTIVVRGHVRTVTPNPPGTNRGSYVFRDSSDRDITVMTSELPAVGKEYTVTATVQQETPEATVPVLQEISRRAGLSGAAAPPAARPEAAPKASAPKETTAAPGPPPVAVAPTPAPASTPVGTPAPSEQPREARSLSTTLLYSLVGVVAIFSVVLIVLFWPRRVVAGQMPSPIVRVEPPVIAAQPQVLPALSARSSAAAVDVPTRFVPSPPLPPPAATTLFVDLGADLIATDGPERGKKFPLTKPRITIGRPGSRTNEVALNDESVSREHAKIVFNSGDQSFRFFNESATNPARVNGVVVESALLQNDDVIQLGATSLKFVRRPGGAPA